MPCWSRWWALRLSVHGAGPGQGGPTPDWNGTELKGSVLTSIDNASGIYEVLWPRGERCVQATPLAPRHRDLAGKRVALLWDYIFKGDVVMNELAAGLKERYPGIEFLHWDEFGNIHGQKEHEIVAGLGKKLRELKVDAVFSGMGC